MANGVITWNGVASDTLGIIVSKVPSLNRPQRKYNSYSVPGRNGDIIVMQDAYAEYEQEYEIFALDGAQIDARAIVDWLYQDGWCQLSDDWEPDYYRMAYFVGPVDIEPIMDEAAVCTITFRCRPQRYLAQGVNMMPKMTADTYTYSGVTVVVDSKGVAHLSGTASSTMSLHISSESSLTFSSAMVGNEIKLNNLSIGAYLQFYERQSSSVSTKFYEIQMDEENKTIVVPSSIVGRRLDFYMLYVPRNITVSETIMPEMKIESTTIDVASGDTVINPTKHTALPIITLTGSEVVTSMLDLEKPYNISFDSDSRNWSSIWLNNIAYMFNSISSDWTGARYMSIHTYRPDGQPASEGASITAHVNSTGTLTFKPFRWGSSDVGVGMGMTLTPDTDYTISCTTTTGNSKIWVGFFESDGNKAYNSSAEASRSGEGQLSLTFHVPQTCANTLFIFYRTDNTTGTFSSIMLASGTEVIPFQPYQSLGTETLTINGTTLSFQTSGFNTAVIDCEKENFTIDGVNANMKATVYDQYGNLATDYLRLVEGTNTVTYSYDITAVSIVPHFWDL